MTMTAPAKRSAAAVAVVAALGLGGAGIALASAGSDATPQASAPATGGGAQSRLDDGKDLLPQAKVSEQQAVAAAQRAASGGLNEVDLEHFDGHLVWNVDVGSHDVKVDAETGDVLDAAQDD
jgi:uncharacterized membrane protein YkoI